jgi:hypothetical protein
MCIAFFYSTNRELAADKAFSFQRWRMKQGGGMRVADQSFSL